MTPATALLLAFLHLGLYAAGVALLGQAGQIAASAAKHQPKTRWDHCLPLNGRWLRYVLAALVGLLALFLILAPVVVVVNGETGRHRRLTAPTRVGRGLRGCGLSSCRLLAIGPVPTWKGR
jgi:hypothetical protein